MTRPSLYYLAVSPTCPVQDPTDRLALSAVASAVLIAAPSGDPPSVSPHWVSARTGMSWSTSKSALARLVEVGVLYRDGDKLLAQEPPASWFRPRQDADPSASWPKRYLYTRVLCPGEAHPLRSKPRWLLVLAVARNQRRRGRRVSAAGLAALTGVSHDTCEKALRHVRDAGWLDYARLPADWYDFPKGTAENNAETKPRAKRPAAPSTCAESRTTIPATNTDTTLGDPMTLSTALLSNAKYKCRDDGWSEKQIADHWSKVVAALPLGSAKFVQYAQWFVEVGLDGYRTKVDRERFDNSYGLVKHYADRDINRIRNAWTPPCVDDLPPVSNRYADLAAK